MLSQGKVGVSVVLHCR
uniref:Uncharacterized protein n=1 Tax=Anguilla anguilla TaxID=7936 RepID=A0A0E9VXU6_ANGAN